MRALADQLIGRTPIPRVPAAARGKVRALCDAQPDAELLLDALGINPSPISRRRAAHAAPGTPLRTGTT